MDWALQSMHSNLSKLAAGVTGDYRKSRFFAIVAIVTQEYVIAIAATGRSHFVRVYLRGRFRSTVVYFFQAELQSPARLCL